MTDKEISWKNKFLNKLLVGDSAELLKEIPNDSIHMIITSPPYFQQRDYGIKEAIGNEKEVEEYIDNLIKVFKECVRIIRPDGHIVFNIGDKYKNGSLLLVPWRFAIEVLNRFSDLKLINVITWVKLNPTPRQYKKRLVSATEPFFDFVKSEDYYFDIDSFLSIHSLLKRKKNNHNNSKIGERYFELIEKSGLTPEQKKKAIKELNKVIREVKEGKIAGFRMKIKGIHALPFGGQEGGRKIQLEKNGFTIIRILGKDLKRDVIESPVETIKGIKHPAIFPEFIIGELIKLLSPSKGIVLDPFVGSGTTAAVAKKLGRYYIGMDINPKYIEYAKKRVKTIQTILEYIV
ncbi:site-specific DNA-methyltransferase [Candidatus Micrarchaeota archaeon]|nr:MAG: site-specific DNA-methyltransferase [Candidatus Micrarchaeota archaeon]